MFHQPIKNAPAIKQKPLHSLIHIFSSEQLLSDSKRQNLIQKIFNSSEFEQELFNSLCLRLMHNLGNRCQRLPSNTVYFNQLGGLLDLALHRTAAAMSLFRQHMTNPDEPLSEEQKQWWYALCSASLLRGIGGLCLDYRVERHTLKGQLVKQWEPLFEPIGYLNHLYSFEFKIENDMPFRNRLSLLLARQLMPEQGFAWIASNEAILKIWLALLDEDEEGAGALSAILDRANAIAIQDNINELVLQTPSPRHEQNIRLNTFVDQTPLQPLVDKERMAAIEFIHWLQQKLESGKFVLNRAPVLHVPGGLLICNEAFELFTRDHDFNKNKHINWKTIQHNVLELKLHPTNHFDATLSHHQHSEGLLLPHSMLLPESITLLSPKGEPVHTTTTAMILETIPAHFLSLQGKWADIASEMSPESKRGVNPRAPYG